ncbi:MAG: HD domain-containing protein [Planctomycetota bacterium]
MPSSKLRRQIAWAAARLMHTREVAEYYQAKQKAARSIVRGWVKPADLPSNAEIRDQVQILARMLEPETPDRVLQAMRLRALFWMRHLDGYHPRLIGSVLTGGIREGSDIDLHLFANHVDAIADELDDLGTNYRVERKRLLKEGQLRVFTHIHIDDEYPIELTVYPLAQMGHRFRSSITGKPIERATRPELEKLIEIQHGFNADALATQMADMNTRPDRASVFLALLIPLEGVRENPRYHPEGDALHHSLQVFELGRDASAWDEEFLLAALLHDVGKAIDRDDHVAAGLEALDGFISDRTAWLIAHHMEAHTIRDRTIGARRRRHLTSHPDFETLMLLNDCDRHGRVPGARTCSPEAALDYIDSIPN